MNFDKNHYTSKNFYHRVDKNRHVFGELVHSITVEFEELRELLQCANIAYCYEKGEYDIIGGFDAFKGNLRMFGLSYKGDSHYLPDYEENYEHSKAIFAEKLKLFNQDKRLRQNNANLLKSFLKKYNNRSPRDCILIQEFKIDYDVQGLMGIKAECSIQNKIDYLDTDAIKSNIQQLNKLLE